MARKTDFIAQYTDWIKQNSAQRIINGYDEITTPFLDAHNDFIQFYVQRQGDSFFFTDDGYTIADIEMNGLNLSSKKSREMMDRFATSLNVTIRDGAITAKAANPSQVAQAEHFMIQAMLRIGDMFYLASPRVKGLFLDDVRSFLNRNDVRYIPSAMFSGKSGLAHRFDFVIPASKEQPERMITTLNHPSKESVQSAIFSWTDVKVTRKDDSISYLILNDKNTNNDTFIAAAKQYDMNAFWWNEREAYIRKLAA